MNEIRLIDANALAAEMGAACILDVDAGIPGGESCTPRKLIEEAPTVDAEIVRHGHWINNGWHDGDGKYHRAGYVCSKCARKSVITYPNCPWCRAKMDEVAE